MVAQVRSAVFRLRLNFRLYASRNTHQRSVPLDTAELYKRLLAQRIESPENARLLKVAVLGPPNSGKSSLINSLCRWRVCAVSQKVHTTRSKANVILTDGEKQLVFVDTPGVVRPEAKKKHNLEVSLIRDPHTACLDEDVKIVCVVQDLSNQFYRFRLDEQVLRLLHLLNAENSLTKSHSLDQNKETSGVNCAHADTKNSRTHKRFILILNKVDRVKKRGVVLDTMRRLTSGKLRKECHVEKKAEDAAKQFEQFAVSRLKSTDSEETHAEEQFVLDSALGQMSVEQRRAAYRRAASKAQQEVAFAHFSEIFVVSCVTQEGIGELRDYLLAHCEPHQWLFPASTVTDSTPRELVESVVWSKFLDALDKEIPYSVEIQAEIVRPDASGVTNVAEMEETQPAAFSPLHSGTFNAADKITILCNAFCKDERSLKFVLGKDGDVVRSIARAAKQELMNLFRCDVSLKLAVVLRKSERQKKAERDMLEALQLRAQDAQLEKELRNKSDGARSVNTD